MALISTFFTPCGEPTDQDGRAVMVAKSAALNPNHLFFFSNDDDSISTTGSKCLSNKAEKMTDKRTKLQHDFEELVAAASSCAAFHIITTVYRCDNRPLNLLT